MGNSSSTRRIVVEEDEQQGAFLVQVSDSVTQQIYGGKEPGSKVARKATEPIHKAVEAAPTVKPALPIQASFPLGPPSPETAAAAVAAITAAPEPIAKTEEKPAAPTDAAAAAASAETETKKPEDDVSSSAAASGEEPTPSAAGAAEEETKPVEEITPVSIPEAAGAAAPTESSVDPAPVPPPIIPQSALLQLLIPSRPPPKEPEAPAVKKEEEAAAAPAAAGDTPAATPVKPSESIISQERELLYKQMGEVYRERDKALRAIEDFYRDKMGALQNQSTKMHSATRQEFNKAVEEVEKKFLKHVESPVAEELQLKVLDCYRLNKAYPLKCSAEVQAFSSAVDQARQDVILAKKG